jgi:hypothetical protein
MNFSRKIEVFNPFHDLRAVLAGKVVSFFPMTSVAYEGVSPVLFASTTIVAAGCPEIDVAVAEHLANLVLLYFTLIWLGSVRKISGLPRKVSIGPVMSIFLPLR